VSSGRRVRCLHDMCTQPVSAESTHAMAIALLVNALPTSSEPRPIVSLILMKE
jgi:hypothetical protein